VTGTTLRSDDFRYVYGRAGRVLRCAWHGWEFEIESGRALVDPKVRAKTFPVEVENGDVYVLV
jgi:nitrite reductase (NADH) small subunit